MFESKWKCSILYSLKHLLATIWQKNQIQNDWYLIKVNQFSVQTHLTCYNARCDTYFYPNYEKSSHENNPNIITIPEILIDLLQWNEIISILYKNILRDSLHRDHIIFKTEILKRDIVLNKNVFLILTYPNIVLVFFFYLEKVIILVSQVK